MNNPYKKNKTIDKKTKVTIIVYVVTALLSLCISMFIMSISTNEENITSTQELTTEDIRVNSAEFDSIQEKNQIDSLIKSYITASVLGEKEILLSLSTGTFKEQLDKLEIQPTNTIKFLSNTLTINTISLSEMEGVFSVKYVLEYEQTNTQQNHTIYTIKENNRWKISNLVND